MQSKDSFNNLYSFLSDMRDLLDLENVEIQLSMASGDETVPWFYKAKAGDLLTVGPDGETVPAHESAYVIPMKNAEPSVKAAIEIVLSTREIWHHVYGVGKKYERYEDYPDYISKYTHWEACDFCHLFLEFLYGIHIIGLVGIIGITRNGAVSLTNVLEIRERVNRQINNGFAIDYDGSPWYTIVAGGPKGWFPWPNASHGDSPQEAEEETQ